MTNTNEASPLYTILMHHEVGDAIDYTFGPMDGAIAVAQIHDQLPLLHRPESLRWWHRLLPSRVRLYRGLLEWGDVGFSYIQVGGTLHVIDGGSIPADRLQRFRPDVVLPQPDAEKYIQGETDHGSGVSILTIG